MIRRRFGLIIRTAPSDRPAAVRVRRVPWLISRQGPEVTHPLGTLRVACRPFHDLESVCQETGAGVFDREHVSSALHVFAWLSSTGVHLSRTAEAASQPGQGDAVLIAIGRAVSPPKDADLLLGREVARDGCRTEHTARRSLTHPVPRLGLQTRVRPLA